MLSIHVQTRKWKQMAVPSNSAIASKLAEVRACTICADVLPLGPKPIFQLHPSARILIAGQAPGRVTHAIGRPFDDASGERLRAWMGIDRATFYDETKICLLPMGFCFPGSGKSGDLPPRPECAATWRRPLLDLVDQVQFTIVMGQYAMEWHRAELSKRTLTENVADWARHWPDQLCIPHPSPRNNLWLKKNPWFEAEVLPMLRARVKGLVG
jgi:uracil-DNA glycosylase